MSSYRRRSWPEEPDSFVHGSLVRYAAAVVSGALWLLTSPLRLGYYSGAASVSSIMWTLTLPFRTVSSKFKIEQLLSELDELAVRLDGMAAMNSGLRQQVHDLMDRNKQAQLRLGVLRQQRRGLMEVALTGMSQVQELRDKMQELEEQLSESQMIELKLRSRKNAMHVDEGLAKRAVEDVLSRSSETESAASQSHKALLWTLFKANVVTMAGAGLPLSLLVVSNDRVDGVDSGFLKPLLAVVFFTSALNAARFMFLSQLTGRARNKAKTGMMNSNGTHDESKATYPERGTTCGSMLCGAGCGTWVLVLSYAVLGLLLPQLCAVLWPLFKDVSVPSITPAAASRPEDASHRHSEI